MSTSNSTFPTPSPRRGPSIPSRRGSVGGAVILAAAAALASAPAAAQDPDTISLSSFVVAAQPQTDTCLPSPAPARSRPRRPAGAPLHTRVVLLGTGTPVPDPDRSGPAVAVVVDGEAYVVDAGVGVVRRAMAAVERGVLPLAAPGLRRVFVTHLHSDHTLGLPDLLLTPWVVGRDAAFGAWGPEGLLDMVQGLVHAWGEDIVVRLNAEQAGDAAGLRTFVCEVPRDASSAVVYRDDRVVVTAFAVEHGRWNAAPDSQRAFGFRFDTPDLSVVISGDTGPAPEVFARHCNGCDVLVHEVYALKNRDPLDDPRDEYDAAYHTSTAALADSVAPAARPGLLVLYHLGLMPGVSEQDLLDEMASYPGRVCVGHDLDVFRQGAESPCTPASASRASGSRRDPDAPPARP